MASRDDPPARLRRAYARTTFRAVTPLGTLDLRVGRRSELLNKLLRRYALGPWAYITAANPGSQLLTPEENGRRNRILADRLERSGFVFFPGEGIGDDAGWPSEESFLVLGMSGDQAAAIGRDYGQLAVVTGQYRGAPELTWCAQQPERPA